MSDTTVSDQYADWLSTYDWSHWITLTYRDYSPTEHAAMRHLGRVRKKRQCEGLQYFACVENGEKYGRTHLHLLAIFPKLGTPRVEDFDQTWRDSYGLTHIRNYRDTGGAASYASKYCTKDLTLWDIQLQNAHHALGARAGLSALSKETARSRQQHGTCSHKSRGMRRKKGSRRRRPYPPVDLELTSWNCNNVGIQVIDVDSQSVRQPIASILPMKMVSAGPSISEIRTNGLDRSDQ